MLKFLLPLIAAIRTPLRPASEGWVTGYDVAQAYLGCKKELTRQAQQDTAQKAHSQAAAETQPERERNQQPH